MPDQIYQDSGSYPSAKPEKKSKLWFWITLSIVIPLFLCCLGTAGCTVYIYKRTSAPIDAANTYYKALKNHEELDDLTCSGYKGIKIYTDSVYDSAAARAIIDSYDFNSARTFNGNEISVEGIVVRNGKKRYSQVVIKKEDGKYKVCGSSENTINRFDIDDF